MANTIQNIIEKNFRTLYDAYHQKVYYFVYNRLKDKQLAEDMVQTVFLKVWEQQAKLYQNALKQAFIFTIARNLLIDHYRKKVIETIAIDLDNEIPASEKLPSQNEKLQQLQQALNKLPQRRKEALMLSRFRGLNYQEIANEMSTSPKTVENHISAALKFLRKQMTNFLFSFFL